MRQQGDQRIVDKLEKIGLVVRAEEGLGLLHRLTGVISEHKGNIVSVAIIDNRPPDAQVYFEIELPAELPQLIADLRKLPVVRVPGKCMESKEGIGAKDYENFQLLAIRIRVKNSARSRPMQNSMLGIERAN